MESRSIVPFASVAWALFGIACRTCPAAAPAPPCASSSAPVTSPSAAAVSPGVPDGYVEMVVADVVPTPAMGGAVLLYDAISGRYVPIFVGGTEAVSIDSRHAKRNRQRPLTHDLLDTLVRELGGQLIKVHVDDLRDDVFIGAVFVKKGDRVLDVDARPSDAMALAIGNRVPIYVARRVLDLAGLSKGDLERKYGITPPDAPREL